MIYFSELKGKKVVTEDKVEIGKLEDLIFLAEDKPEVTKFLLKDKQGNELTISTKFLKNISSSITIEKSFETVELEENELYVLKNLLDKQIIDLTGNKVVRVNDVAFQTRALTPVFDLYIVGVDVGILGIFRWLKVEQYASRFLKAFNVTLSSRFLPWTEITPLELVRGKVQLKREEKKLSRVRAEDLADYLEKTNIGNARKFLKTLDKAKAAKVISDLNLNYQVSLFKNYRPEKTAEILSLIDPDEAVDVLLTLSQKKRLQIIDLLPEDKRKEFNYLMKLSETQIGSLLTPEVLTVSPNDMVREVIAKIRKETADFSYLIPIFVENDHRELIGVFNIHELLLQQNDTPIYKFMVQNVIVVHLTTSPTIALNKMVKYKLGALPVINDEKQILGIVTIVDVLKSVVNKSKF